MQCSGENVSENDLKWLETAYECARNSHDPSTQNGAVVVNPDGELVSSGWNCFPPKLEQTPERWERPQKYLYVEHAERMAVYRAARQGQSLKDCTMYCPWFACADCARAIVFAGIKEVVGHRDVWAMGVLASKHWMASVDAGYEILRDCGVKSDPSVDAIRR